MTPTEFLSQFPNNNKFSRTASTLLFAFYLRKYKGVTEFKSAEIKKCFKEADMREPTDMSSILRKLSTGRNAPVIKVKTSFALSRYGLDEVDGILPETKTSQQEMDALIPNLRRILIKVDDEGRRELLAEAISCLGSGARRASIIMVWVVVIDYLYEYVFKCKIMEFKAALSKRKGKLSQLEIKTTDDFMEMKEADFIDVCRSAKIITKDVRKILDEKLGIRNSCAHPSSIIVRDAKVISFVEDLVDNVVAKYTI